MPEQSLYLTKDSEYGLILGIGERDQFNRGPEENRLPKYLVLDKAVKIPNILPDTEPARLLFKSEKVIELYKEYFENKPHLEGSDIPKIEKSELICQFEMPVGWIDQTKEFLAKTS